LEVEPGHWVWDGLVKVLEVDLFSPAWEVRHGAAMALRELLKGQGKYGGTKGASFSGIKFSYAYTIIVSASPAETAIPMNDGATYLQPNFFGFYS